MRTHYSGAVYFENATTVLHLKVLSSEMDKWSHLINLY
jgi:hypothetical protein